MFNRTAASYSKKIGKEGHFIGRKDAEQLSRVRRKARRDEGLGHIRLSPKAQSFVNKSRNNFKPINCGEPTQQEEGER